MTSFSVSSPVSAVSYISFVVYMYNTYIVYHSFLDKNITHVYNSYFDICSWSLSFFMHYIILHFSWLLTISNSTTMVSQPFRISIVPVPSLKYGGGLVVRCRYRHFKKIDE